MSAHEMCLFAPTVHLIAGDTLAHRTTMRRYLAEALTADMDGISLDALDQTAPNTRTGHGRHSPSINGLHVATLMHRIDREIDSDPIVRALRAHVAA